MIRTVGILRGLELEGEDGLIGSLEDVYFDQEGWRIRHAVVFTGSWLSGRWIVLPAPLLGKVDPGRRTLPVAVSRALVGAAPVPETDRPISRAFEKALYGHYGCGPYWKPEGTTGIEAGRSHLLSAEELEGYRLEAQDGQAGRLEDCLVEEEDWGIKYLCVAARRWLSGRRTVVPIDWVRLVSWKHKRVVLRNFREEIRRAPPFTGPGCLSADYSRALEAYYASGRSASPTALP